MISRNIFMVYIMAAVFGLAGCAEDGERGAAGATGPQGETGTKGEDGQDLLNSTIRLSHIGRYQSGQYLESAAEVIAHHAESNIIYAVNALSGKINLIDISVPTSPNTGAEATSTINLAADVLADQTNLVDSADKLGAANSVAIHGDIVAIALESKPKQDPGFVVIYSVTNGVPAYQRAIKVGALPDSLAISPDGNYVVVANEGEPSQDYTIDPEGSINVIDISGGIASAKNTIINFSAYNDTEVTSGAGETAVTTITAAEALLDSKSRVGARAQRIFGGDGQIAKDIEPEFVAIHPDSKEAYIMLQENNAYATVSLSAEPKLESVKGFGFKDHMVKGNELDFINDDKIMLGNVPLRGVYMPDGADTFTDRRGLTFLVTANEGDSRVYPDCASFGYPTASDTPKDGDDECLDSSGNEIKDGDVYTDELRIKDADDVIFSTAALGGIFADQNDMENKEHPMTLRSFKIIKDMGIEATQAGTPCTSVMEAEPKEDCTYTQMYSMGGRSFSIWNAVTGTLVFDSGNDFEEITANILGPTGFNWDKEQHVAAFSGSKSFSGDGTFGEDRSTKKGPEPKAIEIATVGSNTYAFIALEATGGVMVYDITTPEFSKFVQYINPRDFTRDANTVDGLASVGDLGPEDIKFISAAESPNSLPMIAVGNEVSGTISLFNISIINQ